MSARPFSLDAPASRSQPVLRLRYKLLLIVFGCLMVTVALSYVVASPEGRMILLGASLTLAAHLLLGLVAVWTWERVRRRREDRAGFQEFVQAGAPHTFPALLEAFDGVTPDHKRLRPPPCRAEVVPVGRLKVESGSILLTDPAFLPFPEDLGAAFDEKVPAGEWPVDAVVLHYADGSRQIAALRMKWRDSACSSLVLAWRPNSRAAAGHLRRLPRTGIDSGIACLTTVEAREAFNLRQPAQFWGVAMRAWPAAEVRLPGGFNLFACRSGLGEGDYGCFFGRNAAGQSTGFYVDFGLIGTEQRLQAVALPSQPQGQLQAATGGSGVC
ncbi:MAG: DUF4241 domain-containing protein [Bryobacterales bacterium]|nr:DUF4241 domain-containing protein [Bryobacterales bacterium]